MRLWDFVLDYTIAVMNITVTGSRYAQQRTPLELITGITPDISEYIDFHIYEWVYYRTNAGLGPRELGRWLGISHRRGPAMTYWILPSSGIHHFLRGNDEHGQQHEPEGEEIRYYH